jgi:hypothetical protein
MVETAGYPTICVEGSRKCTKILRIPGFLTQQQINTEGKEYQLLTITTHSPRNVGA